MPLYSAGFGLLLAWHGVEPRSNGFDTLAISESRHIKALLLNPPQGEAGRKEPVFRTGERWKLVNNMNGEKQ